MAGLEERDDTFIGSVNDKLESHEDSLTAARLDERSQLPAASCPNRAEEDDLCLFGNYKLTRLALCTTDVIILSTDYTSSMTDVGISDRKELLGISSRVSGSLPSPERYSHGKYPEEVHIDPSVRHYPWALRQPRAIASSYTFPRSRKSSVTPPPPASPSSSCSSSFSVGTSSSNLPVGTSSRTFGRPFSVVVSKLSRAHLIETAGPIPRLVRPVLASPQSSPSPMEAVSTEQEPEGGVMFRTDSDACQHENESVMKVKVIRRPSQVQFDEDNDEGQPELSEIDVVNVWDEDDELMSLVSKASETKAMNVSDERFETSKCGYEAGNNTYETGYEPVNETSETGYETIEISETGHEAGNNIFKVGYEPGIETSETGYEAENETSKIGYEPGIETFKTGYVDENESEASELGNETSELGNESLKARIETGDVDLSSSPTGLVIDECHPIDKEPDHLPVVLPLAISRVYSLSPLDLPDTVVCNACRCTIFWKEQVFFEHKRLHVITCEKCYDVYHNGDFVVDTDGNENYCTLCGDGGDLILCDECPKSCCQVCIRNVSGQEILDQLLNDTNKEWLCWSCDPTPLAEQRALYKKFYETFKERRKKRQERKKRLALDDRFKSKEFISSSDEDGDPPSIFAANLSETETDAQNETETDAQNETETNAQNETETDAQNETEADARNETEADARNETETDAQNETETDAQNSNKSGKETSDAARKTNGKTLKRSLNHRTTADRGRRVQVTIGCDVVDSSSDIEEEGIGSDPDCGVHVSLNVVEHLCETGLESPVHEEKTSCDQKRLRSSSGFNKSLFSLESSDSDGLLPTGIGSGNNITRKGSENIATRKGSENIAIKKESENIAIKKESENITTRKGSKNIATRKGSENIATKKGSENITTKKGSRNDVGSESIAHKKSSKNKTTKKGSDTKSTRMSESSVSSKEGSEIIAIEKGSDNEGTSHSLVDLTNDLLSSSSDLNSDSVTLSDEDLFAETSIKKKKNVAKSQPNTSSRRFSLNSRPVSSSRKKQMPDVGQSEFGLESLKKWTSSSDNSSSDFEEAMEKLANPVSAKDATPTENKATPIVIKDTPTKSLKKMSLLIRKKRLLSYDDSDKSSERDGEEVDTKRRRKDRDGEMKTASKKRETLLCSSDDDSEEMASTQLVLSSRSSNPLAQESPPHLSKKKDAALSYSLRRADLSDSSSEEEVLQKKRKIKSLSDDSSSVNSLHTAAPKKIKKEKKDGDSESSSDFEQEGKRHNQSILRYFKRKKKSRKNVLSTSSEENSDDDDDEQKKKRKKTTPTKSSEEENTPQTPGKRKNIRKLISKDKLALETKEAQKAEKERMERLKKRNISLLEEEISDKRLILDQDSDSKEVLLEVRRSLVPHILPHQVKGIKFLYDCCCEDLKRLQTERGSGAILAHCMGLGKTLQVIALLDCLLTNTDNTNIKRVLVLSPVNALLNWKDEWNKWVSIGRRDYRVSVLEARTSNQRAMALEGWFSHGGSILMGYEMFRNLASGKNIRKSKLKESFVKYLLDPGPDLIVCDEGHVLRHEKSNLSQIVNRVSTRRRIVLTGTPLQNNLEEYYTMVNFVKPNLLGTPKEFSNRFSNPISNGQHADSRPADVRIMKMRAHVLNQLLSGCVDRKDYRILAESLPPKHEYVVSIRMSPIQEQLITRYLGTGRHEATDLFSTFASLVKVWNHPWVLMLDQERKELKKENSIDRFINDEEEEEDDDDSLEGFIVRDSDSDNDEYRVRKKPPSSTSRESSVPSASSSSKEAVSSKEEVPAAADKIVANWYEDLLTEDCSSKLELSGKLVFLMELLKETEKVNEKVIVFSQSLLLLDLIEELIQLPQYGDFMEGINYFRLDGSTKAVDRTDRMKRFNRKTGQGAANVRLFLISTKAGSLGVNLIGANRVVVFDACWNPSHDLQSIFRSYRFGQTKPVFVYRLLAQGTMEEKIYDRQVTKTSLSLRVIDEKQIGRHYTFNQLQELFTYTPPPPIDATPTDATPERPASDIIFCKILDKLQPATIVKYHEHNSLLEHVFDEELSEEERKAAWENYNAQKEMDSRAYNIGINMHQTGVASGEGPAHQFNLSEDKLNVHRAYELVNGGIQIADSVLAAIQLRNILVPQLYGQPNPAIVQRYVLTCNRLNLLLQQLQQLVPQIRERLSNNVTMGYLSDEQRRDLDRLRVHFLQKLKEIDERTKVQAPDPNIFRPNAQMIRLPNHN